MKIIINNVDWKGEKWTTLAKHPTQVIRIFKPKPTVKSATKQAHEISIDL